MRFTTKNILTACWLMAGLFLGAVSTWGFAWKAKLNKELHADLVTYAEAGSKRV